MVQRILEDYLNWISWKNILGFISIYVHRFLSNIFAIHTVKLQNLFWKTLQSTRNSAFFSVSLSRKNYINIIIIIFISVSFKKKLQTYTDQQIDKDRNNIYFLTDWERQLSRHGLNSQKNLGSGYAAASQMTVPSRPIE